MKWILFGIGIIVLISCISLGLIMTIEFNKTSNENLTIEHIDTKENPMGTLDIKDVVDIKSYQIIYGEKTISVAKTRQVEKTYQEPVYQDKIVEVRCDNANMTCKSCKNDSKSLCMETTIKEIDKYKEVKVMEDEVYYEPTKVADDCNRQAIIINNVTYVGQYNIYDGIISKWKYPQACRNWNEFPRCRDFEMEKGVCEEVKI